MNNTIDPMLVIIGVILTEIGGIGLIRQSQRFRNPSNIKKLGRLICILGLIALIFSVIGIWFGVWS
jgi:multisubunit Na+/H+ antiporter MnhG subunit